MFGEDSFLHTRTIHPMYTASSSVINLATRPAAIVSLSFPELIGRSLAIQTPPETPEILAALP
jgi:hypothetical protein